MTVGAVRRAKALAHVVPVLVRLMLLLVFGAALPGLPGSLLALAVAFAVPFALTKAGERATVRVFLRARAPSLVHRVALTPVAQVLHDHGVRTDRLTLLVTPGPEVDAYGVGRHTILVTTALVEALVSHRVSADQGAAVLAHEVGVLHTGLAKGRCCPVGGVDPVAGLVAVGRRDLRGPCRDHRGPRPPEQADLAAGGACLWLAYDEDQPAYLGSVTILALVLAVPVWDQGWRQARHQIGDTYLHQVGLGQPFATFLWATCSAEDVRERALRLSMKVPA